MKLRFLLLAVAGIGMLACSKDGAEGPAVPDGSKSIVLKIALPQTTRAIPSDDPYSPLDPDDADSGTTISSVDVYFTNDNGTIEQSYRIDNKPNATNLNAIKGAGLRFTGLENVTRVYCVANCADANVIGKGKSIKDFTKKLSEQNPNMEQNASIFVGYDADITPIQVDDDTSIPNYDGTPTTDVPEAGDQVYNAIIQIRPMISRIEWGKITIEESGHKVIYDNQSPAQPKYFVVWQDWTPKLTGIYQSNVYLTSKIFANADADRVDALFATPASMDQIVRGAWAAGLFTDPATLAYSEYVGPGDYVYDGFDLTTYNASGKCIPFHFFVPFDASLTPNIDNDGSDNNINTGDPFNGNKPHWHFQLQYENPSYTYTVYEYNASLNDNPTEYETSGVVATDDDGLKVSVDFAYPLGPGNLAYANVDRLLQSGTEITYQPGKIYKADITIAPFNITSSFTPTTDYNVIVKVSVVDFESETVTPGFN